MNLMSLFQGMLDNPPRSFSWHSRTAQGWCKTLSVICPCPRAAALFWERRSEGERSEPSAAAPKKGGGATHDKLVAGGPFGFPVAVSPNTTTPKP